MKKTFNTIVALLLSVGICRADPIPVQSHLAPGGSSAMTTQQLAEGLQAKGYNIDYRVLNNCPLARSTWDNSKGPVIMLRDSAVNTDLLPECYFPTNKDTMILYANSSPIYFCNTGPNGKTWEDFIKPGSVHIIGDTNNLPAYSFFDQISKATGNRSKVIQYANLPPMTAAIKSNEVDFFLANGPWAEQQIGSKCFFITGLVPIDNHKLGIELFPNIDIMKLTYGYWFVAKGFNTEEMAKLRKDAQDIWNNKSDWVDYRKKRGWNDNLVKIPLDQAIEQLNIEMQVWNRYRR
jgi:hypothetical protein